VFAVQLRLFPVSGRGSVANLVLPAITLGAGLAALLTRLLRSSLIEALNQDYVRTAHAKGARPRVVLVKHAMRNAILGYLTVLGLQMASLLAGSVVTEQVFAWPGIGLLAVQAINSRDMAVVQAIVIVSSLVVMVANLVVDVLYAVIDPRIQGGFKWSSQRLGCGGVGWASRGSGCLRFRLGRGGSGRRIGL